MRLRTLCVLALLMTSAYAETPRQFAGRQWSIDVPAGYTAADARPDETMITTAFTPAPRADGTRPLVQVTLIDLRRSSGSPELVAKFAEAMIAGVQRRREEWQVEKTTDRVGSLGVTRYAWSGVTIPAADGAAQRVKARGVMLVGVDGGVGFVLHTQDVDVHAMETLPPNEKVLRTFRFDS